MAAVVSFAWPAPAGASPYVVATERLVVQLSAAAQTAPGFIAREPARRRAPTVAGAALDNRPARRRGRVGPGALTASKGVDYVSPVEAVQSPPGLPGPRQPLLFGSHAGRRPR